MALAKGTEPLAVGIDSALMAELRAFAEKRGEKIRAVVEAALRRHMANPPPLPALPPLPPVTVQVRAEDASIPARTVPAVAIEGEKPKKKSGKGRKK